MDCGTIKLQSSSISTNPTTIDGFVFPSLPLFWDTAPVNVVIEHNFGAFKYIFFGNQQTRHPSSFAALLVPDKSILNEGE